MILDDEGNLKKRADMTVEEKALDNKNSKARKREGKAGKEGEEPREPRAPREPKFDENGEEILPKRINKKRAEMTDEEKVADNKARKQRAAEKRKREGKAGKEGEEPREPRAPREPKFDENGEEILPK